MPNSHLLNAGRTATDMSTKESRKLVASSHEGKYTYHMGSDLYVYQRRESDGAWIGWLCSISAWEFTFSKARWITLAVAANCGDHPGEFCQSYRKPTAEEAIAR